MKKKVNRYDMGYFVDPDNRNDISTGLGTASSLVHIGDNPNQVNRGSTIAGGALSGAAAGYKSFGLVGGAVGAVGGAAMGIISANKRQRQIDAADKQLVNNNLSAVDSNLTRVDVNPYGNQMYADGGKVSPNYTKTNNPNLYKGKYGVDITRDGFNTSAKNGFQFTNFDSYADWVGSWAKQPKDLSPEQLKLMYTPPSNLPIPPTGVNQVNTFNGNGVPVGYTNPNATKQVDDYINQVKATHNPNMRFAQGGDIPSTNQEQNLINIEKNELLIDPQSGKILQDYKGINPLTGGLYEPHNKKGPDPDSNMTFADPGLFVITKKKSSQYRDAVDNNDKIAKETILMNIKNAKIAKEGGLKGKYADGSTVYGNLPPYPQPAGITSYDSYTHMLGLPQQGQLPSATQAPIAQLPAGQQPVGNYSGYIPNAGPREQSQNTGGLGTAFDTLNKYGPALYNLGQGLFGQTKAQPYATPITNPYKDQVISNLPRDVDYSSIVNDIYANQAVANKDILNNTGSSAIYRANRQQLASNTARQVTGARLQADQANNQVRTQRSNIYDNLGMQDMQEQQQRRQYNLGVDDINTRRQAAKSKFLESGIGQLQQINQNDKLNDQKQKTDLYSLSLLKQMYPSLNPYNMFDEDYIKKLKNR